MENVNLSGLMVFDVLDVIALIWFYLVWYTYALYSERDSANNLFSAMRIYHKRWMKGMIQRDDRLVDMRILGNLVRSNIFFASTSILIIAGLVAVMGYGDKARDILLHIPLVEETNPDLWVIKILLLVIIFVYSFFKFTWALRQFNFLSIVIISSPKYDKEDEKLTLSHMKSCVRHIKKSQFIMSNAARHFNKGIRSYYFGLVALSWFIGPVYLIIAATLVVLVLYRREFVSKTLIMLLK